MEIGSGPHQQNGKRQSGHWEKNEYMAYGSAADGNLPNREMAKWEMAKWQAAARPAARIRKSTKWRNGAW